MVRAVRQLVVQPPAIHGQSGNVAPQADLRALRLRGALVFPEERGDRTGRGAVHDNRRRTERPETRILLGIDEVRPCRVVREPFGLAEFGTERNRAHVDPLQDLQPAARQRGHHANLWAVRPPQQDRANRPFAVQRHGLGDEFENALAVEAQRLGLARFLQRIAGPLMPGLYLQRLSAQSEGLGPDPLVKQDDPSQGGAEEQRGSHQDRGHPVRRQPRWEAQYDDIGRRPEQQPKRVWQDQVMGLLHFHRADSGEAKARTRLQGLRRTAARQTRVEDHFAGLDHQN